MASYLRTPLRTSRAAMVAAANPIASLIGVEILRDGGNAMDAAIAMSFAMAVLEPNRSHLGGDVFLQFWDARERRAWALNGSGEAPSGATIEAMGSEIPGLGIRASTVPGAVDGWLSALSRWGTMPAAAVLAPAIELAEDGFATPEYQIAVFAAHEDLWAAFPRSAEALRPDAMSPGSATYQPELAQTLRDIAEGGRDAFYDGAFATRLIAYSDENDGFFNRMDLSRQSSDIREPIQTTYRGVAVTEQPPVSQGHILLEMLNIVEGFDLSPLEPLAADTIHVMVEAKKLAFADRLAFMGDVANTPLPTLLSKEHAARQRSRIQPQAAARYNTLRLAGGTDTTSLCAVDARGNAVTLIQSVFHPFGSGVVIPGTGVLMNDRMTGFSRDPAHPNALEPGKRPMHTLNTYMLLRDGALWAVGGTPGGDVQVQTNLQVISAMIDFGLDPQTAIELPKWHARGDGYGLIIEDRLPLDTAYELRRRGHEIQVIPPWDAPCASQVIVLDPETRALQGASDPRAEGLALGY